MQLIIGAVLLFLLAVSQVAAPFWAYLVLLLLLGFTSTIAFGRGAGTYVGLGMVACAGALLAYAGTQRELNTEMLFPFLLGLASLFACTAVGSFIAGLVRARIARQDGGKGK